MIFICGLGLNSLLSQELDSASFELQLHTIDSLERYGSENCVDHIDSISVSFSLSTHQQSYVDIIKAGHYALQGEDSLAAIIIEKEQLYLESTHDTSGFSYAKLLETKGDISDDLHAAEYYLQSIEIRKKLVGEDHFTDLSILNKLALNYYRTGRYKKSISVFIEIKDIVKEKSGEDHPDYMNSLNNVASLYIKLAEYSKAEPLFIKALEIRKKTLGEKNISYLTSLSNLASLYHSMGQYEKAERLLIKAKYISYAVHGNDHPKHAATLNNLAIIYESMREYEKAEPLMMKATSIQKEANGVMHPEYATCLKNLADLYKKMNQYEKAEPLYIESKNIRKDALGSQHPSYAAILNSLANLYTSKGHNDKAEPLYVESKGILEATLGKTHPNYASTLSNMASLYESTGDYKNAAQLILEANDISKKLLVAAFDFLSENEKLKYHQRIINSTSILKSLGLKHDSPELAEEIYNTLLFEKGIHLKSNIQTKAFVQKKGNGTAYQTYQDLMDAKEKLYVQYQKPDSNRKIIDLLENDIEQYEKKMARVSASFRRKQMTNNIDHQTIAAHLQEGEVAIEFTHFKLPNDSIIYMACILNSDEKINIVPLTYELDLNKKLKLDGSSNSKFINSIYGYSERGIKVKEETLPSLYEMIWQPLDPFLSDISKIYFAPSGLLNRMNINAIALDDEYVLADRYDFVELLSTRDILLEKEIESGNNAYLVGGVVYDLEEQTSEDITDRTLTGESWNYLKWTLTESQNINTLFTNASYDVSYRTETAATEEDFKSIGTVGLSPSIIHLSTHGYFFPEPQNENDIAGKNKFALARQPLLRSGLILAGGNQSWRGIEMPEGAEDGILTAYEISNMDLSNTELVVLSACETGLGDIEGSEGVYGLQRSFKMAGVRYLIMSLWQVPDRATSVFMTRFYENYLEENMTIREAFNKTQLEMRDRFFDPYNWAGFVLIE